jgi:hypothetical protein
MITARMVDVALLCSCTPETEEELVQYRDEINLLDTLPTEVGEHIARSALSRLNGVLKYENSRLKNALQITKEEAKYLENVLCAQALWNEFLSTKS